MAKESKLVVILGETATGKTTLALRLAQEFNGEIICADSTTVRRELNIGTAKPTPQEQASVPHHLLDLIGPCDSFTVADFKKLAQAVTTDISKKGKLPIMVGGSGLYIDSVVYEYNFRSKTDQSDRQTLRPNSLMIGLQSDRQTLRPNISQRVDAQLAAGLEAEVRGLVERYGWDCVGLKSIAYAQWREHFEGHKTLAETRQAIIRANLDLSKRQRTWFKRNKSIQWKVTPVNWTNVVDSVTTFLQN